jgi:hypothetical protein
MQLVSPTVRLYDPVGKKTFGTLATTACNIIDHARTHARTRSHHIASAYCPW